MNGSSAVAVNSLVFSGGEVWSEDEPDARVNENLHSLAQSASGPSGSKESDPVRSASDELEHRNVSTYVRVFEDMICTVIRDETHLLNDEEFALLTIFAHLSYNARFLMVKLLLRKQDTWHRLDSLKYDGELGSMSAIVSAVEELCKAAQEVLHIVKKEESEPDLADTRPPEPKSIALARSEREMDLRALLECLRMDELKAIAKHLKLKTNQKKSELINDLLGASSSQLTLTRFACRDSDGVTRQTKSSFTKLSSQQDRLREMALGHVVKCVRVDNDFFGVIHRVNIVYFRITQYTPGILVAALLTRFGKRAYPGYDYERTKNVWPTRQALLEYEEVLLLEGKVDMLLAGNVGVVEEEIPITKLSTVPGGNANNSREERALGGENGSTLDVKPDNIRVRGARMVKEIFEDVYPRWKELVRTKSEGEDVDRAVGLERFHYGHVLTRIVCKGSTALGSLGEYERELEVLEALLAQKRWRRGQRGRWHERRALVLSTHLPKDEETTEQALSAVMEALVDPDTHIVFRPKLQRRLRRLENKLKIPIEERHTCDGILVDADEVVFEATRLRHRAGSLKLDRIGRCIRAGTPQEGNQDIKRYYSPLVTPAKPEPDVSVSPAARNKTSSDVPKGKSVWLGRNGEELTVEELALRRYQDQGFKGVHCESRVITMLFSLLFWDIIFKSIPGAFETPYQTAPLDIAEDSFYHARKDLMEDRLSAIEGGKGVDLVRDADAKNRTSETWCVGVRWDLFSSEDLVDIVACIGGKALAVICRVLCEDYTFGTSGGPDLFLWNAEKGTCKFVEVKGPGDTLQENQRIWIDILLKAPVAVEICRIVESGSETDKKPNARTPKSTRKRARKMLRNEEKMNVDTQDVDALPTIFDGLHAEEQPVSISAYSSPGFVDPACSISTCAEGTSNPLKRKASPPGAMLPTPSKRPRSS